MLTGLSYTVCTSTVQESPSWNQRPTCCSLLPTELHTSADPPAMHHAVQTASAGWAGPGRFQETCCSERAQSADVKGMRCLRPACGNPCSADRARHPRQIWPPVWEPRHASIDDSSHLDIGPLPQRRVHRPVCWEHSARSILSLRIPLPAQRARPWPLAPACTVQGQLSSESAEGARSACHMPCVCRSEISHSAWVTHDPYVL